RMVVDEMSIIGISTSTTGLSLSTLNQGRFTPTKVTSLMSSSILNQFGKYSTMSATMMKKNSSSGYIRLNVFIVSIVYDFPERSISIVLILKCGCSPIALCNIFNRSSTLLDARSLCGGSYVGINH